MLWLLGCVHVGIVAFMFALRCVACFNVGIVASLHILLCLLPACLLVFMLNVCFVCLALLLACGDISCLLVCMCYVQFVSSFNVRVYVCLFFLRVRWIVWQLLSCVIFCLLVRLYVCFWLSLRRLCNKLRRNLCSHDHNNINDLYVLCILPHTSLAWYFQLTHWRHPLDLILLR